MKRQNMSKIVEDVRYALERRDYKAFAACFHHSGVYERPYALKGAVNQYKGADNIYEYIASGMAAANKSFEIISLEAKMHPCVKENIVFVEFFLSGKPLASPEPFRIASSAALIACKDNKIINYRDFPNSAGIAEAAGTLPQFAASLVK